jgi:signal transduction histidine kinase
LISKQKKIDEELSQAIIKAENATATAEHAVIAKATILSNMSHEIRTECDNWLYKRFIENRFIRKTNRVFTSYSIQWRIHLLFSLMTFLI